MRKAAYVIRYGEYFWRTCYEGRGRRPGAASVSGWWAGLVRGRACEAEDVPSAIYRFSGRGCTCAAFVSRPPCRYRSPDTYGHVSCCRRRLSDAIAPRVPCLLPSSPVPAACWPAAALLPPYRRPVPTYPHRSCRPAGYAFPAVHAARASAAAHFWVIFWTFSFVIFLSSWTFGHPHVSSWYSITMSGSFFSLFWCISSPYLLYRPCCTTFVILLSSFLACLRVPALLPKGLFWTLGRAGGRRTAGRGVLATNVLLHPGRRTRTMPTAARGILGAVVSYGLLSSFVIFFFFL